MSPASAHLSREAARAFGYALALSVLAFVLGALSDEGNVAVRLRVARMLPATAAAAGAAALWASSRCTRSGELRTYSTCGGDPRALAWAWALGAASIGIVGAVLLCAGLSTEGFLPPPPVFPTFTFEDGGFKSEALGVVVRHGLLESATRTSVATKATAPAVLLAFFLGCASIAMGLLGAGYLEHWRRTRAAFIAVLSIVTLLLCASERIPNAAIGPLGLCVLAAALYKRETPAS
jgi:hypothetical protein